MAAATFVTGGTARAESQSSSPRQGSSATAVYSAVETVDAPPPSTFPGAGGAGDGWAVALSPTQVFNVVHHKSYLEIDCHEQSDASTCTGYPKTITETVSGQTVAFGVSGQPGMWLDQSTGHLYVFATSESGTDTTESASGGVVCIDTTSSSADPFCGFTVLGNSPLVPYPNGPLPNISAISDPVIVGTNWYAFNYFFGASPSGSEDEMYCFSLTSLGACPDQPYPVDYGGGAVTSLNGPAYDPANPLGSQGCGSDLCPVPSPVVDAVGSEVIVPATTSAGNELGCFDAATDASCGGDWPVAIGVSYPGESGGEFPLLDASGAVTGICLPWGGVPCYSLDGGAATTPPGITSVIGSTLQWDGPAVAIGPRVYLPDGYSNEVLCFDYSTDASCANFPRFMDGLGELYTVNRDPQRPTCLWVNADNGEQLQSFDAYSAGTCEQNPLRVLASAVIVPQPACYPLNWDSLQVVSPARSAYTSGSVQFDDGDANPLPNLPTLPLDSTGSVDLANLAIPSAKGLPEFLVSLTDPPENLTSVVVKLTWTADYSTACLQPGTTVEPADVTLTKTESLSAPYVGAQETFVLHAANAGPSDAGEVVVTDDLARGLVYDSSAPSAGSVAVSGQQIVWTIPDLGPPGGASASATLDVVATVDTTAPVTNVATFTQTTPGLDGVTTGSSNTVSLTPAYADVVLRKTAGDLQPNAGSEDTFTLTPIDRGPDAAGRVVVTDDLPSGLAYDSSKASTGTVSVSGNRVTWTIPDLLATAGGTAPTLQIVVTVHTTSKVTNAATFAQTVPDGTGATSGTSDSVELTPLYAALMLSKTVSSAAPLAGDDVTYTLAASNRGPDPADGVVVTDVLPAGVSLVSTSPSSGSVLESGSPAAATLSWDIGSLADGATVTLRVVVEVTATSGQVVNEARLTSTTFDTAGTTRSASASFVVTAVVPATHTGEPWSGGLYWTGVSAIGGLGLVAIVTGRRRRRPSKPLHVGGSRRKR